MQNSNMRREVVHMTAVEVETNDLRSVDPSAKRVYRDHSRPEALPEDIILSKLRECTAMQASFDFVRALCVPDVLRSWVTYMAKQRPLGLDGSQCAQNYLEKLFMVFLREELRVEIVTTISRSSAPELDYIIYPFGLTHPHIRLPIHLLRDTPAILAYLTRMLLVTQAEPTSTAYSRDGGAFASTYGDVDSSRVTYSQFAYNSLFDLYFPRFQFVACYVASVAGVARIVDNTCNIDIRKAIALDRLKPEKLVDLANLSEVKDVMRSESAACRLLMRAVLRDILASFALQKKQNEHYKKPENNNKKPSRVFLDETRRSLFFMPYVQRLFDSCDMFQIRDILSCWEASHDSIAESLAEYYPVQVKVMRAVPILQ